MDERIEKTAMLQKGILHRIKAFLLCALNPAHLMQEQGAQSWYLYLIYPAAGWLLFFLQVGLDTSRVAVVSNGKILATALSGFAVGYIVVGLVGLGVAAVLKSMQRPVRSDAVISTIALSHTYMVFSLVLGLIYSAFGVNSSTTFGVAGLLCTLLPIYSGIRTLGRGNAFLAPLLATCVGAALLACWRLIMFFSFHA